MSLLFFDPLLLLFPFLQFLCLFFSLLFFLLVSDTSLVVVVLKLDWVNSPSVSSADRGLVSFIPLFDCWPSVRCFWTLLEAFLRSSSCLAVVLGSCWSLPITSGIISIIFTRAGRIWVC